MGVDSQMGHSPLKRLVGPYGATPWQERVVHSSSSISKGIELSQWWAGKSAEQFKGSWWPDGDPSQESSSLP